jgi:hypothetical protein
MKKILKNKEQNFFKNEISRRHFVKITGITTLGVSAIGLSGFSFTKVSIIHYQEDPYSSDRTVLWAVEEFEKSLVNRGISVGRLKKLTDSDSNDLCVVVTGPGSGVGQQLLIQ